MASPNQALEPEQDEVIYQLINAAISVMNHDADGEEPQDHWERQQLRSRFVDILYPAKSEPTVTEQREVWAFLCHKPERFGGVISPELGAKEVAKFCGKFAAAGYAVTPVYDRAEYLALIAKLKD